MQRRTTLIAAALCAAVSMPALAQNALDEVMAKKPIKVAIPTDFPPYGFVGTDLKPQGLDVDMANYIGPMVTWELITEKLDTERKIQEAAERERQLTEVEQRVVDEDGLTRQPALVCAAGQVDGHRAGHGVAQDVDRGGRGCACDASEGHAHHLSGQAGSSPGRDRQETDALVTEPRAVASGSSSDKNNY